MKFGYSQVRIQGRQATMSHPLQTRVAAICAVMAVLTLLSPVWAQPAPMAAEEDGRTYTVTEVRLRYLVAHPKLPAIESMQNVRITLGVTDSGYVAARPGVVTQTLTLSQFDAQTPRKLYATALQQLLVSVRDELVDNAGLMGVFVTPDPTQINEQGEDLRGPGETHLNVVIAVALSTEVRTLAFEKRIDPEQRINHPDHQRIRDHSPVQPFDPDATDEDRNDLLQRRAMEDYATFLSRHPGRRVDVSVGPATTPGGVSLDYLVTEHKPWLVYYKLANTGTENTNEWRHQIGARHYQLTGIDDIFAVDYATAGFEDSHFVAASYDRPLSDDYRLRGRAFGGYSEYRASDVGIFSDDFSGESYHIGGELDWNFCQVGEYFFDVGGGVKHENIQNSDTLIGTMDADSDFLLLYVMFQVEGLSDWHPLNADVRLEFQSDSINDHSAVDLANHGRAPVDESWTRLMWDATQSVYLEPLLDRKAWQDPATPAHSTLAHELYARFAGQHTFGDRVIPSYQMVAGGFYTVRGYPESVAAGDTVLMGTLEYRFHLPRALPLDPDPPYFMGEPFRVAPQQVYGPVDWDFIIKGFIDAAHTINHGAALVDRDSETLVGAGAGIELQYKRNVTIRADWGVALHEVPGLVTEGSQQFHFELTLLY